MSNPLAKVWPFSKFYAAGYDAAERTNKHQRLQWGRQQEKDEDHMVGEHDKKQLRMRCRNLQRNDSITRGIIERFSDNVVGSGITPQASRNSSSDRLLSCLFPAMVISDLYFTVSPLNASATTLSMPSPLVSTHARGCDSLPPTPPSAATSRHSSPATSL